MYAIIVLCCYVLFYKILINVVTIFVDTVAINAFDWLSFCPMMFFVKLTRKKDTLVIPSVPTRLPLHEGLSI